MGQKWGRNYHARDAKKPPAEAEGVSPPLRANSCGDLRYPTQPPQRNISRVHVHVWLPVGLTGRLGFAVLPVPVPAVLLALQGCSVFSSHQFLSGCHARSRASSGSSVGKVSRRSESCWAISDTCSAGVGGGGPEDSITVGCTATESSTDPTTPRVSSTGRGGKSSSRRCWIRS